MSPRDIPPPEGARPARLRREDHRVAFTPGDHVVLTRRWQRWPGSAAWLEAGAAGRVIRIDPHHCAVEIGEEVHLIPPGILRRAPGDGWLADGEITWWGDA